MNKIYLGLKRFGLNLTHYAATNPLVIEQSVKQILNDMPAGSIKFLADRAADKQKFGCSCTSSGSTKCSEDHGIQWFKANPGCSKSNPKAPWGFCKDAHSGLEEGWTVTYICMQVLYYIGCKTVVVTGMDHYFEQSGKPGQNQVLRGPDPNHFDPNYFSGQHWHLAGVKNNEISYHIAKKVFEADGREIIDASVGGHCNIFRKMTIDQVKKNFFGLK